jgi:hypothetical protein
VPDQISLSPSNPHRLTKDQRRKYSGEDFVDAFQSLGLTFFSRISARQVDSKNYNHTICLLRVEDRVGTDH